jgi:hypothetical protein
MAFIPCSGGGQTGEAHVVAQQAGGDGRGQRGRVVGIERFELDMADHDAGDPGLDDRPEGAQVVLPQVVQRAADHRQADV